MTSNGAATSAQAPQPPAVGQLSVRGGGDGGREETVPNILMAGDRTSLRLKQRREIEARASIKEAAEKHQGKERNSLWNLSKNLH